MFAKIALLALVAACMISSGTEAQYLASPAYGYAAAYSPYAAAYSPYYYGSYAGYAGYPTYWGYGSNKNGAPATTGAANPSGPSLTNNQ